MRLNSIRLQNFRQHTDTFIEFDQGLTGIIGPNGTGKSTILEAIAWALYGNPAARGTRETIKSLRAPARASVRVELDFELGGHRYQVHRGLTGAELYLDRGSAPIANSISGVAEVLRRRLGMTHEEFFNTYFTGQKELSVMAAMGPTERAQFLSRLLGYERLRVAQEIARERRRTIVAELNGVKSSMADPDQVRQAAADAQSQLATAEEHAKIVGARRDVAVKAVGAVAPEWKRVQEERTAVQRIDGDRRVAESDQSARRRELDRLERELADLGTAQAELASLREAIAPLAALRAEREAMDVLAREEGRRQALLSQERELVAEYGRLEDRRKQLEQAPRAAKQHAAEMKKAKAALEEAEKALDTVRTEWVRDRQEAETRIEQLKISLADVKKQREILLNEGENGTCPICARPLGDHYRTVLESIDEQLASITENGRYFKARVKQLATTPEDVTDRERAKSVAAATVADLESKQVRIQAELQEVASVDKALLDRDAKLVALKGEITRVPSGYSAERHAGLRKRCDELQALESRASRLAGALERESHLRLERERVAAAVAVIQQRLDSLDAERAAYPDVERRFEKTRVAHESAIASLSALDVELATASARLAAAADALETAAKAVADLERAIARLDELNQERRLHEELDRAYTDLRTELNIQLRPELSDRASVLLAELTDGRYSELELDESYEIVLIENGMPKHVISGGEEDLANLVLRVAISQMIAERAGQPLSLLILDEVFGSLDESRRANVMDLLHHLRDRFEQIVVITHIESIAASGLLNRRVSVAYDEEAGVSRISDGGEPAPDPEQLEIGAA